MTSTQTPLQNDAPAAVGYSDAYTRLVEDDEDLVGIIAYALYKNEKREFITLNRLPSEDPRVRCYHHDLNANRVKSLRVAARQVLNDFTSKFLEEVGNEEINELQQNALYRLIKGEIRKGTSSYKSVLVGMASSVVLGVLLYTAKIIDWENPFHFLEPAKPTASSGSVAKAPPPDERPPVLTVRLENNSSH